MKELKIFGLMMLIAVIVGVSMVFVGCRRRQWDFTNDVVLVVLTHEASIRLLSESEFPVFDTDFFPELRLREIRHNFVNSSIEVWRYLQGKDNRPADFSRYEILLSVHLLEPSHQTVRRYVRILNNHPKVASAEPNYIGSIF